MANRQVGERVFRDNEEEEENEEINDSLGNIEAANKIEEEEAEGTPPEGKFVEKSLDVSQARSVLREAVLRHIFSQRRKHMLAQRLILENQEEIETEAMSPATLAPAARGIQTREALAHVQPGAFRVTPNGPAECVRPQVGEDESEDSFGLPTLPREPGRTPVDEIYLVEADLVLDEPSSDAPPPILVEALPLRRKRYVIFFGIASVFVVAIAVGISLAVAASNKAPAETNDAPVASSASRSSNPTAGPSILPSGRPSNAPSLQPSSLPTSVLSVAFRQTLPNFTQKELLIDSTPQSRAFEWVTGDDWYRNLSRRTQRFALATLFYATAGETKWRNTQGWLNSSLHECHWFGCNCTGNGTMRALDLSLNKLRGLVPKEICLLSALESLKLSENSGLKGSIASELGWLTMINSLDVRGTRISGSIPNEIGILTRLSDLLLGDSQLSGHIPTEIGNLSLLTQFDVFGARLVGTIPTELGRLSFLVYLSLAVNSLSSTLPKELGGLSSLQDIDLSDNKLNGTLPSELGSISSLLTLYLYGNALNGPVPTEFGSFPHLEDFALQENNFSGPIPTAVGRVLSLTGLSLFSNRLTGTIPTELGLLSNIRYGLTCDQNQLTGTLPSELGRLSNALYMDFYENQLEGSVPPELCELVLRGLKLRIDCEAMDCSCGCTCWNESNSRS
jgi:Leucine-rich repeat (LRR) protein